MTSTLLVGLMWISDAYLMAIPACTLGAKTDCSKLARLLLKDFFLLLMGDSVYPGISDILSFHC